MIHFLGPTVTGKSHLAIVLGVEAINARLVALALKLDCRTQLLHRKVHETRRGQRGFSQYSF